LHTIAASIGRDPTISLSSKIGVGAPISFMLCHISQSAVVVSSSSMQCNSTSGLTVDRIIVTGESALHSIAVRMARMTIQLRNSSISALSAFSCESSMVTVVLEGSNVLLSTLAGAPGLGSSEQSNISVESISDGELDARVLPIRTDSKLMRITYGRAES
jgi:hypothetical protein